MANITTIVIPEGLGTATAKDVARGVTFTSDNGIRLVGTSTGGDSSEPVSAVLNDGGSVTETYKDSGKVITTTFIAENQVEESIVIDGETTIRTTTLTEDEDGNIVETVVEGDTTIVKKTIINEDGSVDEQIL